MPFPDDYYTVKDSSTATGRRVNLTDAGMPQNVDDTPVSAAPYNLNDGFSPGQVITLKVPGLDTPEAFANTNPIPLNDLSRNESQDSKEPIVVIDAATNKRVPIWVELDSNATSPAGTALLIHARDPVRGRPPLHRRDAQAQGLGGQQALRAGGLPLLPRRPALERGGDHQPVASGSRTCSARCARRKSSATTSTWRGTSPSPATRTSPAACCTCAMTRSRSSATPAFPTGSSRATRPRSRSTRWSEDPNPGQIAAPDHGHVHGALLPDQQLRGAGGHRPGRGRQPDSARHLRRRTSTASSPTPRDRVVPAARRCTATVCWAVPARSARARSAAWRRRTTSSSAPPTRSASPRRTSRTRSGSSRTWAASPSSPTASSRGC